MNKAQLLSLLDSYVTGTCTPEEIRMIDNWLDQYQDGPDVIDSLSPDERESLKNKIFSGIVEKDNDLENEKVTDTPQVRSITRRWWISLAAAALILLCMKFFIIDKRNVIKTDNLAVQEVHLINHTKFIVKQVLSDGSTVWLNPGATLYYPRTFKLSSRNVMMRGECFFEITKNPKRPFIINSDHMVTKVWGTSFRITDYSNASTASVVVVTGKVSVSKKSDPASAKVNLSPNEIILHPQERVSYDADKNVLAEDKNPDMASLAIWKRIDLSFNKTRLSEMVTMLNRNFSANIIVTDGKLNNVVMNADLNDLNLPEVLEVLKVSLKLNYEISDNQILLSKAN